MDQLLRRTRMAERQVERRLEVAARQRYGRAFKAKRQQERSQRAREATQSRKDAIRTRHEDWEMGPLAPRRDIPATDNSPTAWASISATRVRLSERQTEKELEGSAAWAGGLKSLCLAPGDRVVVMEGHSRGTIGEVEKIDKKTAGVYLKGVGKVNATLPEYLRDSAGGSPVGLVDQTFPISAVRLVHPMERDGKIRDVIIRELKPGKVLYDRPTRKSRFSRIVPGLNVVIPWPDVPPTKYDDHPGDTLRLEVETRTFVPTLLRPPMPEALIDELRNRYSRFRTRHTDEYIAEKEAEQAAKEARKRSHETMMMPVEEFNRQQRELRRARGQPVLSEEMLQKIGEVIAKNKNMRMVGGLSELEEAVSNLSIKESSEDTLDGTGAFTF